MDETQKAQLTTNIVAGLPGRMTERHDLDSFRDMLAQYKDIDEPTLRANLVRFLERVLPRAEAAGVKLAIHPDDPPWSMFGLPRVVCTPRDLDALFGTLPGPSNGMTLCVGTYSSRPDNDLVEMARQFGPRIHFSHLRSVSRDPDEPRSFSEASHLDGDVDLIGVIHELLLEEKRRAQDRRDGESDILIRPDHGHQMLDDLHKSSNPGYSAIGRLKGLAEIRGVVKTCERFLPK